MAKGIAAGIALAVLIFWGAIGASPGAAAQGLTMVPSTAAPAPVLEVPYAWSSTAIAGLDHFDGPIPVQARLEDVTIKEQPGTLWGRLITFTIGLAGGMILAAQLSNNVYVFGLGAALGGILVPALYLWAVGYGS